MFSKSRSLFSQLRSTGEDEVSLLLEVRAALLLLRDKLRANTKQYHSLNILAHAIEMERPCPLSRGDFRRTGIDI